MSSKIKAIITDALGDRVIVYPDALSHAIERHFPLFPEDMVLQLIERVLRDPSDIFEEKKSHVFHLFYKLSRNRYMVAIVKRTPDGCFFVTAYPTGTSIRKKHSRLKRVKHEKS